MAQAAAQIVFATTCKGRTAHLRQTLPRNLEDNPRSRFVVLDYSSDDGLADYLRTEFASHIQVGRLVVYTFPGAHRFHMAHAKNMAHRCGILEGADILVTLDADNFAGHGFEAYIRQNFGVTAGLSFLCPNFETIPAALSERTKADPTRLGRGFAGRLAIRANDFVKLGGYNETYDTWRGEDIDLIARLDRLGLRKRFVDDCFLNAVPHSADVRFHEYPHAREYENRSIYTLTRQASDTVVNYGQFGCGVVHRNWDEEQPIHLAPVPTRVFGVGFQRTGTTSLHEACRALGMDSGHWESGDWALAIWREMNRWGRSATLERRYALCDNPIPLLYQALDRAYPGSKFILTVRNERDWLRSVEWLWSERNPQRWTWDVDRFSHRMHAMLYGQATFNAEVFLARYRRHNAEVLEYFRDRPDDLLVMDLTRGDGWLKLCQFLGVMRLPGAPFPRANPAHAA